MVASVILYYYNIIILLLNYSNLSYQLSYLVLPFVAFRINSAISSGCDTSDAWLELSDRVVAFIRFAKLRCTSGGIMWSLTWPSNHVGSCFQAGGPDGSVKSD